MAVDRAAHPDKSASAEELRGTGHDDVGPAAPGLALNQCGGEFLIQGGHRAPPYISEPGVVSSWPVSSQVFRPERIIGQPPYNWSFAPSRSWSWMTVSLHESPTGSISQVTRLVPSACTSGPHSARIDCTSLRGGSTSRFSPSLSGPGAPGWTIRYDEPWAQSDSIRAPKWYRARMTGSVTACHSRSGVVRM